MASTAYRLMQANQLEPLEAYGWLHALKTGQIVIPDYNEQGERGPLLSLILSADRPQWGPWKNDAESIGVYPNPPHEDLVIWAIENGADPWTRHNGNNAWSEALFRGWPKVMKYLANRPDAPPKQELEQEPMPPASVGKRYGSTLEFSAPASFAYRNQIEALEAWASLGFSVNLGVGGPRSAGTEAKTPEFLAAWVKLGGDITAPTHRGQPLKAAWNSGTASWRVAMEREWLRHQPKQDRPVDDRLAEAVDFARQFTVKTLFVHRLKELELTPTTEGSDGRPLWERWWTHSQGTPSIVTTTAAVSGFLLESASDEVAWQALVEGLRFSGQDLNPKQYPSRNQLMDALKNNRFGSPSQALRRLASELMAHPNAMNRLFDASRSLLDELELKEAPRWPVPEKPTYFEQDHRLANFWGEWFFEPSKDSPAGRGWLALVPWAQTASMDENAISYRVYRRILSEHAGFEERQRGAELIGVLELMRKMKVDRKLEEDVVQQWHDETLGGWAEGLRGMSPSSPPVQDGLVDMMWSFLEEAGVGSGISEPIRAHIVAERMTRALPQEHSAPAPRPRM